MAQKGLHGLLVRLNEVIKCGCKEYQCYRHVHPAELALFNGMLPNMDWGKNHKLALCALGQLASPIQSTWIGSLLMQSLQAMQGTSTVIEPFENLMSWIDQLLAGRDIVFGPQQNPNAKHFQSLVKSRIYATKTSPQTSHVDIPVASASTVSQDNQMPTTTEACDARDPLSVGTETMKAKGPSMPSTATGSVDHPEDPQEGSPNEITDPTVNMLKWVAPQNGGVFGFENQHPPKRRKVGNGPVAADIYQGNQTVPFCDAAQTMLIRPEQTQMPDSAILQPECHEGLPAKTDSLTICPSATATPAIDPPTPFQAMPLPRLGCGGPSHGVMTEITCGSWRDSKSHGQATPCARPDQVPLPSFASDVGPTALTAELPDFHAHDKSPPEQTLPLPRLYRNHPVRKQHPSIGVHSSSNHITEPSLTELLALHDKIDTDHTSCQQDLPCQTEDSLPGYGMEVSDPDRPSTHTTEILQAVESEVANAKSSCSSAAEHDDPPTLFQAMPPPRLGCGGPSHDAPTEKETELTANHSVDNGTHEYMNVFVKHEHSMHPIPCTVPVDCTAGTLTKAEAALKSMTMPIAPRSLVGTHLPLDSKLHPDQYVMIYQNFPKSNKCPFFSSRFVQPMQPVSKFLPCTRLEALWHQEAWVANDEMNYYLEATMVHDKAFPFPTAVFMSEADAEETASEWLDLAINALDVAKPWCSAAIIACHWVPVVITHFPQVIEFSTTPEGSCLIQLASNLVHARGKTIEVKQTLLPQAFPADCGFQTLAWLVARLHEDQAEAISPTKAALWRQLFIRQLCQQDIEHQIIHHLPLGGTKLDAADMSKFIGLLTQHGVMPERANERASMILAQIPASNIKNILASQRPWPDLKAAANSVRPQIKLILPDELNQQIAHRAEQRKYGKKTSAQRRHEPAKIAVTVQASELLVPQGVFKQHDGTVLGPIQIGDVGPAAKGVLTS